MEDFDIPQNKLAETAERVVDRALEDARRREHALLTNEHFCLAFAQVEWDTFGQVMHDLELNPHEILQALEEHLRLLPPAPGSRPARRAVDQAAVQARAAAREPLRPPHDRGDGPLLGHLRGDAGHSRVDHPPPRHRAGGAGVEAGHAHARPRAARGAPEEALRAAGVPQALRDQPESARASGSNSAGVRPRRRDGSRARDPVPPRARQLRAAARRAGRRQDGDCRRDRPPPRVRARQGAGPPARLPDRQPADEHDGRGHDAARHVRGSHSERDPRDQGAAEPDPVHRRSAHDDRRRLRARRAVGRGQRVQVGARARRGPHHRRDDARASTRNSSRKTRRSRAASAPCRSPSRPSSRPGRSSTTFGRGSSATTRSASRTRRSRRRWRCRRATCAICSFPTR